MYNKNMRKRLAALLIVVLLLLSGCTRTKRYFSYTVYPVGYLLNRIAGDRIETISVQTNQIVQAANPVDNFEEILDDSAYFFHIGDLEPYYDIYEKTITESEAEIVDLSSLNAIYKFERYTLVYVDGKESFIESPYYNDPSFDNIDTNEHDLLLWIDPIGMLSMAKDIYSLLASNYVEFASSFEENYKKLESELISLDAAYQNLATKLKKENVSLKFVTMSASFGNWQKAYGFQVYPVCLSKYGALPSEHQLEIIKTRIKADDVRYIVFEPNMTDAMVTLFEQLESELGLKRIYLSNISSLSASQMSDNKDYFSLMYENLSVLDNIANIMIESKSESITENNSEETTANESDIAAEE